jgi:hypothetical protein
VFADWADKVRRQLVPLVNVSADLAYIALLLLLRKGRFGLDVIGVILVGKGGGRGEYRRLGNFGGVKGVGAPVPGADNLAG